MSGGRPPLCDPAVLERVVRESVDGSGPTEIARRLTREGIPTPGGATLWYPQTVHQLLRITAHGQEAVRRAEAQASR
jgi:hypothetical protein